MTSLQTRFAADTHTGTKTVFRGCADKKHGEVSEMASRNWKAYDIHRT